MVARSNTSIQGNMDSFSTPSRRSFDLPKPDTGLAEWTSKIKAIQRQVDADEENEQKRLEEEIAAARQARLRRSRGAGGDSRTDSLDLSRNRDRLGLLTSVNDMSADDTPKSFTETQNNRDTALLQLMDRNQVYNPDKVGAVDTASLASFMGGRAAGPRLNRHARQVDAHDPTQFIQPDLSAPHPVLGTGGLAMPAISSKRESRSPVPVVGSEMAERYRPSSTKPSVIASKQDTSRLEEPTTLKLIQSSYGGRPAGRIPTYSLPRKGVSSSLIKEDTPLRRLMERNSVYNPDKLDNSRKSVAERVQSTSLAVFMGGSGKGIRLNKHAPQADAHDPTQFMQPDLSAPHPIFGQGGVAMPGMVTRKSIPDAPAGVDSTEFSKPSSTKKPTWPPVSSAEQRLESPQRSGGRTRTISAPRLEPHMSFKGSQTSSWTPSHLNERSRSPTKISVVVPLRDRTLSTPSDNSSRQASVPPSLARSTQANPTTSLSPQIPGNTASPAFNKQPTQKDLTPSLSRLQGRGFVQNMVKASTQISNIPPSPFQTPSRPASTTGRKGSVLDRWQPTMQPDSPTKSTSFTTVKPTTSGITGALGSTKSPASLPSLSKPTTATPPTLANEGRAAMDGPYPRSRTPGLGSATTMVVIKPSKSFTDLTELGMKSSRHDLSDPEPDHLSRKTPIYFSRDKTREPKKNAGLQRLTEEGLVQKSFEDLISVPHSASASAPSFTMSSQKQRIDILASPVGSPDELKTETVKCLPSVVVDSLIEQMETRSTTPETFSSTPTTNMHTSPVKERSQSSRIPSSGNRPTVMEVAQALSGLSNVEHKVWPSNVPENTAQETPTKQQNPVQAEKRRSNYGRYSAITLPPLPEETTPVPSPAATLKVIDMQEDGPLDGILGKGHGPNQAGGVPTASGRLLDIVHIPLVAEPCLKLRNFDVTELLRSRAQLPIPSDDIQTISVEVYSIFANSTTIVTKMPEIFYDTEILAIVHRVKSKASGLASTNVWCWLGKHSLLCDQEEKKLQELSKRYGTTAKLVHQLAEPIELAQVLDGRIAIRQGTRNHWTSENTTMHLIRSLGDVVLIDERDFNVKNMCSAFSYCFTILSSIYLWYGCGSTPKERQGALDYARTLSPDVVAPIELFEGRTDTDEVFWMVLGDDVFAKADYWQWRPSCSDRDPMIWRIDIENPTKPVVPVEFISMEQQIQNSIYVINCTWELFVLVGKGVRARRETIRWALELSTALSLQTAAVRPYPPTVHVLILPSQLPIDLRLGVRDLDEAWVNNGEIPRHMNLVSCSEATVQLNTYSWELAALKDPDMLPLGVDASMLS